MGVRKHLFADFLLETQKAESRISVFLKNTIIVSSIKSHG